MPRVLVVGIGNAERGDDAVGVRLLSRLVAGPDLELLDAGTSPESYAGTIIDSGAETVLFLDAVDFGGRPGEVAVFDHLNAPRDIYSTHLAPLSLLMNFVERESGAEVLLLGVQPRDIRLGAPMSPEVARSVDALASLMGGDVLGAVRALRQAADIFPSERKSILQGTNVAAEEPLSAGQGSQEATSLSRTLQSG